MTAIVIDVAGQYIWIGQTTVKGDQNINLTCIYRRLVSTSHIPGDRLRSIPNIPRGLVDQPERPGLRCYREADQVIGYASTPCLVIANRQFKAEITTLSRQELTYG